MAAFLHYFSLVIFAWMLVEGLYLYVMVITVFQNSKEQFRIYGICAYGMSAMTEQIKQALLEISWLTFVLF